MAQNEIVNVLTIKTEESQRTIKGLKKEIADLKKILDNAVIGSEEFEQASRDLKVAQNELKAAMTGQRQSVDALEGSYDALVQEMAKLKKEWRATADVAKRNEIGQQIEIINNQLKELDATIGNNQRKVGAYAEEIGKVLAKNSNDIDGLAGSVAGNAATFKQALSEQDDATISTRTKLESIQKVTAGLASGYAAVQGAMALLGIENENLEKTFVKLQAAMAIAQGVGGMKDLVEGLSRGKVAFAGATNGVKMFIKGLSGVQKAIIGTGIGALVVAVGLLIANWEDIVNLFSNTDAIDDLQGDIDRLGETFKQLDADIDFDIRVAEAVGKTKEEIIELRRTLAKDKLAQAESAVDRATTAYHNMNWWDTQFNKGKYKKAVDDAVALRKQALAELNKVNQDATILDITNRENAKKDAKRTQEDAAKSAIEAAEQLAKRQKEIDEELRLSKFNEEEKLIDALDKKYIEYMKVYEGNQEKQMEILEWYTDEYTKIVEKGLDEQIAAQQAAAEEKERITKEEYEKKVAASEKRLNNSMQGIERGAEQQTYLNERRKPKGNGEINSIDNELSKLETLKNITNETLNLKVAAIEAEQALFEKSSERWMELENQKIALREQTNRTLGELSEQYYEQEKNRNRALAGSITNTFTATLSSASAIIGALQEGIDTTNKEGFEKNKKMQIANATIQMLVGITSALAGAFTTKSGPWDIALAAIQAATIATTGGIQIAKIKQQTFDGGNSSITPSVSPNVSMDLPVSYTRNLMGNMETEEMNTAQRVYILESDIEESGRRVEIRDNNTNF